MFIFSKQPSISLFLISLTLLLLVGSSFSTNNQIKGDKEINVDGDDLNVLKKHVSFFDRNKDGIVYPKETFEGFRAIGANVAVATAASAFINMGLSSKTRPGKLPSPLFPIEIENINLAKHTSDSGVYDTQGRFVPEKFEEIFQKYAHTNATYLTSDELYEMLKGNRAPNDPVGWLASTSEWRFLYTFGKDENGLLQKETIRAAYDGSVFEQLEQKNKKNA